MPFRVCTVAADGTAAVATPVPDDQAGAAAYAAAHGGEVVSAELVEALRRGDQPADGGVTVAEFTRRLAPVFLALGSKPAELGAKWDRVFALLAGFTVVYPTREPVAGLIAAAVADGLLTADQAAALAAG